MERRTFLAAGAVGLTSAIIGRSQAETGAPSAVAGQVTLLDFIPREAWGEIRNGVSSFDVGPLIARANALGGEVRVTAGRYHIGSSSIFTVPVRLDAGALFDVAAGRALTFKAGFFANPSAHVFDGNGSVAFNAATTSTGYPEWWGARTGDATCDCQPALAACVTACSITKLAPADYWISNTWAIETTARVIEGVNGDADGSDPQTRIVMSSATSDIIRVGLDRQPQVGAVKGFPGFIHLKDLTVTRAVAPAPPQSGFSGPAGFRLQWLTSCSFENLWSNESTNGFYIKGLVFCKLNDCHGYRSRAGANPQNDYFAAFLQDNSARIGLNSGNASIYYDRCSAVAGLYEGSGPRTTYGIYTVGGFTDTFVFKMETSGIQYGQVWNGSSEPTPYPAEDLIVTDCVLDGCIQGIVINAPVSLNAAAVLKGNYFGSAGAQSTDGILVSGTIGAISITANQFIGGSANIATRGLHILNASGVIASSNIYTDLGAPVVLQASKNCRIADLVDIQQPGVRGAAAVSLVDSRRNVIDCTLRGRSPAYAAGVAISGASSEYNEVRCSGLDPDVIVGGPSNKLVSNGARITTAGPFGGKNLASGIME